MFITNIISNIYTINYAYAVVYILISQFMSYILESLPLFLDVY